MKKYITTKLSICLLLIFSGLSILLSSCEKVPGHVISTTTVVKSGTLSFTFNGSSTTLATTTDTVFFNSTTAPVTTITAKNAQKNISLVFSFNANIPGSYVISSIQLTTPQSGGGTLTSSASNTGSVTIDAINVFGGSISGSFTSNLPTSASSPPTTSTITGTFNIQQ
jgi:hypothetical protein